MNNRAPDFSDTFEIVDSQIDPLEDADNRIQARRKQSQSKNSAGLPRAEDVNAGGTPKPQQNRTAAKPIEPERKKRSKGESAKPMLVKREVRRNLTLKVLEHNETRFNQLFHQLQLAGDGRRKQELADEAIELLLGKYAGMKV